MKDNIEISKEKFELLLEEHLDFKTIDILWEKASENVDRSKTNLVYKTKKCTDDEDECDDCFYGNFCPENVYQLCISELEPDECFSEEVRWEK